MSDSDVAPELTPETMRTQIVQVVEPEDLGGGKRCLMPVFYL